MGAATFKLNSDSQRAASTKSFQSRRATSPTTTPEGIARTRDVECACTDLQWLVVREARRVARRVPYFAEIEDLIGAGSLGLVTAVQRHIGRPAPILQRFAQLRVRGAIIDHLRANDPLTRRQRAAVGAVRKTTERLQREGAVADTEAIAQALGMTTARVDRIQHRLAAVQVTHIDDEECFVGNDDPSDATGKNELRQHVVKALGTLPKKLQTLLSLYYYEGLSYREIGSVLGVTDSRVCQLHTQATSTLRRRLAHLR